jgi:hypothetical protein
MHMVECKGGELIAWFVIYEKHGEQVYNFEVLLFVIYEKYGE